MNPKFEVGQKVVIESREIPAATGVIASVLRIEYRDCGFTSVKNIVKGPGYRYYLSYDPYNDGIPWGEAALRPLPDDKEFKRFIEKLELKSPIIRTEAIPALAQ